MYVSEIYSYLLKRAQSRSDNGVWLIYDLIEDEKPFSEYLDKDCEVKRFKFRDGSFIDIEHIHCKDGKTSIRETNTFYPKLND